MHPTTLRIAVATLALAPATALASFHFMQIEQAMAGINGDPDRQAVQLRMRSGGQNQLQNARLFAFDASGDNPVQLIAFPASVPNGAGGARVLVTSAQFATDPAIDADFVFDQPIPHSYLAAGRLTFEDDFGTVLWSLCWGGADYTGDTSGSSTNDADGNFGPCFDGPLPALTREALVFDGAANAGSTGNAADYTVAGPATFTNNAGASAEVTNEVVYASGFEF